MCRNGCSSITGLLHDGGLVLHGGATHGAEAAVLVPIEYLEGLSCRRCSCNSGELQSIHGTFHNTFIIGYQPTSYIPETMIFISQFHGSFSSQFLPELLFIQSGRKARHSGAFTNFQDCIECFFRGSFIIFIQSFCIIQIEFGYPEDNPVHISGVARSRCS